MKPRHWPAAIYTYRNHCHINISPIHRNCDEEHMKLRCQSKQFSNILFPRRQPGLPKRVWGDSRRPFKSDHTTKYSPALGPSMVFDAQPKGTHAFGSAALLGMWELKFPMDIKKRTPSRCWWTPYGAPDPSPDGSFYSGEPYLTPGSLQCTSRSEKGVPCGFVFLPHPCRRFLNPLR